MSDRGAQGNEGESADSVKRRAEGARTERGSRACTVRAACEGGGNDAVETVFPSEAGLREGERKRFRRVATYVSEVDRRLIAQGIAPSWEDRVREEDTWPGAMCDHFDRGNGANDQRLLDNVPPHWQPRS